MGARILVVDDSPTIRKVVAAILEKHQFSTTTAEDGEAALAVLGKEPVDLVLVDFVMPRMNGYQLCRELRAHPEHKALPVVLMSAKGDRIRGQFVQQTGAVDAITKPFDARALVAVIEGALERQRSGRTRPAPEAETMVDEDAVAESLRPAALELSDDPGLRRLQAANHLGQALGKLVQPELAKVPDVPPPLADALGEAVVRAITPEALRGIAGLIRTLEFGDKAREALSGDVSVISIAEILQLLELQRQTGVLVTTSRSKEVVIAIREGFIDQVTASGLPAGFLLGRYLVEDGVLSRDDLNTVLANRGGSRRLLGEQLVALAMATEEQVKRALVRQTSELVYEVVRWSKGHFTFTAGAISPEAERARLSLQSGGLMMEGFRRVDEWRLIEESVQFDEVLYVDGGVLERFGEESKLTKQERAVLAAIDGERTVREVVDEVEGSAFELCKILYQFLNSRLVRRKSA